MDNILAIGFSTFKEVVRRKVLYVIIAFCVAVVASSLLYKTLSIDQDIKLMKDVGLATMTILGMLVSIFVGSSVVSREIDTKTIQTLFAKPVRRDEFILGKFFGASLVMIVNLIAMSAGVLILILLRERLFDYLILKSVLLLGFELLILISVAILLSTFLSGMVAGIFTFCVFIAGHVTYLLPFLIQKAQTLGVKIIGNFFYYILPNLQYFNIKGEVVNRATVVPWSVMGGVILYGLLYSAIIIVLSILVIRAKDLE